MTTTQSDVLTAIKNSPKVLGLHGISDDPYTSLGRASLGFYHEIEQGKLKWAPQLRETPSTETTRVMEAIYRAKAVKKERSMENVEIPIISAPLDWEDDEDDA